MCLSVCACLQYILLSINPLPHFLSFYLGTIGPSKYFHSAMNCFFFVFSSFPSLYAHWWPLNFILFFFFKSLNKIFHPCIPSTHHHRPRNDLLSCPVLYLSPRYENNERTCSRSLISPAITVYHFFFFYFRFFLLFLTLPFSLCSSSSFRFFFLLFLYYFYSAYTFYSF